MFTEKLRRRGTTEDHKTFIGALAEVTFDTEKRVAVIHDNETPGGFSTIHENHTHDSLYSSGTIIGSMFSKTLPDWLPVNGQWVLDTKKYKNIVLNISSENIVTLFDTPIRDIEITTEFEDFITFNNYDGKWMDSDGDNVCFIYMRNIDNGLGISSFNGGVVICDIKSGEVIRTELWPQSRGNNQFPNSMRYFPFFGTDTPKWIVVGNNRYCYISSDLINWEEKTIGNIHNTSIGYNYDNGAIIVGSYKRVSKSYDKGESWHEQTIGTDFIISISYSDNVWMISDKLGKVYRSTDDGSNWDEVLDLGPKECTVVQSIDENGKGRVVCGSTGGALKYSNDYENWTDCYTERFDPIDIRYGSYNNGMWTLGCINDRSFGSRETIYSVDGILWKRFNRQIMSPSCVTSLNSFGEIFQLQYEYKSGSHEVGIKIYRYILDAIKMPLVKGQNELIKFYMKT